MNSPDFFTALEDHRGLSLLQFEEQLRAMPKKVVGTVQLFELCAMADHPNGLYFFFDGDDKLWYVGKSTSRSFIERIPSHFDQREGAWFNTLPTRIRGVCSIDTYADAHALSLSLRLIIVGVRSKELAIRMERVFRAYMKPYLNTAKSRGDAGTELLSSYEV